MNASMDTGAIVQSAYSAPRQATDLARRYTDVRAETERLCAPLVTEDYGIQTMPDVSPPKWHLAHTAWFFECFVLTPFVRDYSPYHPRYHYLFNSYYETVGRPYPRPRRGLLSRPTVAEIYDYRAYVDAAMLSLLQALPGIMPSADEDEVMRRTLLGVHHEQQHQELLLTDIKHIFAMNPLRPEYQQRPTDRTEARARSTWCEFDAGMRRVGHDGSEFAFDNETPRHKVYANAYAIASRLVTNGEYLQFMEAGGYAQPEHWLSDGWTTVRQQKWQAPLYWERYDGRWWHMTLSGMQPIDEWAPVCHVSLYEADAFARWRGKRLPTEAEWEVAASREPTTGNLRDAGYLHPRPAPTTAVPAQLFGDVWEWTCSAYGPYPGYRADKGALGEYNGKFMSNQVVLRGGSCVTAGEHVRSTYRNFFYPGDRWQFTGLRLADDR